MQNFFKNDFFKRVLGQANIKNLQFKVESEDRQVILNFSPEIPLEILFFDFEFLKRMDKKKIYNPLNKTGIFVDSLVINIILML